MHAGNPRGGPARGLPGAVVEEFHCQLRHQREGNGDEQGDDPRQADGQQVGQGFASPVLAERVADGEVALDADGQQRQDGAVVGCVLQEGHDLACNTKLSRVILSQWLKNYHSSVIVSGSPCLRISERLSQPPSLSSIFSN